MNEPPTAPAHRSRSLRRSTALALLLGGLLFGALQLSFLCDDAYITFRYVSNAHEGHGLVWNPAPFAPVEGYTSFLWAALLWWAWSWFGIEPPASANVLSLLCGIGQFAVVAWAASRIRGRDGRRLPDIVVFCILAAVVGNRTFLAWLSSGLETALFNLAFIAWVVHAFRAPERRDSVWLAWWSTAAATAALTRPDGLLFAAATGAMGTWMIVKAARSRGHLALALSPLLLIAAHLVWRYSFYGEWLPNTYYAKTGGSWPEAGLRYFLCFVIEHGVWLWVPLCLVWIAVELSRGKQNVLRVLSSNLPAVAAICAVLIHFVFYTYKIGGDHFEYRVYCHLVPLGMLAAAAMAARLAPGWKLPVIAVLSLMLASCVGWLHLWLTRDMPWYGFRPVADRLPAIAQPLGRWFDRQQAWLRLRLIGLRCQHHAMFLARAREALPHRMRVEDAQDPFPAFATGSVGLAGWALPDIMLIDVHGLNDWVIARSKIPDLPTPLSRQQLRNLFGFGDTDGNGFLDETELRTVILSLNPAAARGRDDESEYLAKVLMAIYARERPGAMSPAECESIGESLIGARSMAHERHPPDGYVEELQPNVHIKDGRAHADPRAEPLTADAIRELEAKWRARVGR